MPFLKHLSFVERSWEIGLEKMGCAVSNHQTVVTHKLTVRINMVAG